MMDLGFNMVRVRYHGEVARVEVTPEDMPALLQHHNRIQMKLTSLGFTYVSLDLRGYRTGSMNEVLPDESLETVVG
jgi:uncharacterized protein